MNPLTILSRPGLYRICLCVHLGGYGLVLRSHHKLLAVREAEVNAACVSELLVEARDQGDLLDFLSQLYGMCMPVYSVAFVESVEGSARTAPLYDYFVRAE